MYKQLAVSGWLLVGMLLLGIFAQQVMAQGEALYAPCTPVFTPSHTASLLPTLTPRPSYTTVRLSTLTPTTTLTPQPPAVRTAIPNATWLDPRDLPYYQTAVYNGDQAFRDATARALEPSATQELSLYTPTPIPQTYVVQVAALNVRKTPGSAGALNGTVRQNTRVLIYNTIYLDGYLWGQFGAQQWIALAVYNNGQITTRWASPG